MPIPISVTSYAWSEAAVLALGLSRFCLSVLQAQGDAWLRVFLSFFADKKCSFCRSIDEVVSTAYNESRIYHDMLNFPKKFKQARGQASAGISQYVDS